MNAEQPTLTHEGHELTRGLLRETREELVRADTKASYLLAALGVIVGVVLGGAIAGDWTPNDLTCTAEFVWWVGVVAVAGGAVALGNAVFPRLIKEEPGRVTYFEDARRHTTLDALIGDLNKEAELGERDAEQLMRLSKIASRKYRSIQVAMWALVAAALLCSGAGLFG